MKRELIECIPATASDECLVKVGGHVVGQFGSDDAARLLEQLGLKEGEASRWANAACFERSRVGRVTLIND